MRLYHIPGTRSSRVRWAFEEAGVQYDVAVITREERQEPAFLARHPLGRVPVVETPNGHVFESAALILHASDLNPASGLMPPAGSHERALVYQWVMYGMIEMEGEVVERYRFGDSDPERAAAGVEAYRKAAKVVEDELAGKEFLVGGTLTAADIVVGGVCQFGAFLGMNDGFPNIAAYLERLQARPAFQAAHTD